MRRTEITKSEASDSRAGSADFQTWPIKKLDGVSLVFSPLLMQHKRLIHAFTTRLGGNSPEPLHSFNLSLTRNVEGSRADAIKNRRRLCESLKLDPDKMIAPVQTHSSEVRWVDGSHNSTTADGLVTAEHNMPLLLQFADCVPVILYDPSYNAVAVVHAGWRGTAAGIVKIAVKTLLSETGSDPEDLVAAVGPAIGSCCYPTGQEVLEKLAGSVKTLEGLIRHIDGKPHPDLKAINAAQLQESHIANIDVCSYCTSCTSDVFYSHRKHQGRTGHQGAIAAVMQIMLAVLFVSAMLVSAPGTALAQQQQHNEVKNPEQHAHLLPLKPKLAKPEDSTPAQPAATCQGSPQAENIEATIDQLESITFGTTRKKDTIADRLSALELAVLHQNFDSRSNQERVKNLQAVLEGSGAACAGNKDSTHQTADNDYEHDPAYTKELPPEQLYQFALTTINEERKEQSLTPLQWDEAALKVAQQHITDLAKRSANSHFSNAGDNPDLRYTQLGGTDALTESIVSITSGSDTRNNKVTVIKLLAAINSQQDDRDAIFSPDATHFGFAYGTESSGSHVIACAETVTRHGVMHSIPKQLHPGEKIEIKGVMIEPYRFQRITLAWEGRNLEHEAGASKDLSKDLSKDVSKDASKDASKEKSRDSSTQATAYFPPLDYVAYAAKAQRGEHERAANFLRMTGVVAAIAGGMFLPPVALAAPLIAMSGSSASEPHPMSEIPVHGGIKVVENLFFGSIPISHQSKEGLYYVTVWAITPDSARVIPISRRVIIAKLDEPIKVSSAEKPHTVQALK